ncbi:MAG TPA: PIN domain-containing protein [Bryobacteraceae bacterium]|nr:PIN domain-containing protein [Bryobacteraceae bacterium]
MDPNPGCYVDTSALIAFLDRGDRYHATCLRLFSSPPPLVTSALVVAEGHGWFLRRVHVQRAMEFLSFVRSLKPLAILPFGRDQIESVRPLLTKFEDQGVTMADVHGLFIMQGRRIKVCWSTDRHLGLTGANLAM